MNKVEFVGCLEEKLKAFPKTDIDKSLCYYTEMIDDRIEDGMSEQDAVAALGNIDGIVDEIKMDSPLSSLMKVRLKPKNRLKVWEIILLILGFPLWFPLLVAFFAVILAVYAAAWAIIISFYSAAAALTLGGIAGCISSGFLFIRNVLAGLFILGCSISCIGLGILAFLAMKKV